MAISKNLRCYGWNLLLCECMSCKQITLFGVVFEFNRLLFDVKRQSGKLLLAIFGGEYP